MRVLFLSSTCAEEKEFNIYRNNEGIDSTDILKNKNFFTKCLLALSVLIPFLQYFIYGNWKKRINDYDCFIVNTRRPSKYAVKYLGMKKKKIICCYWNKVSSYELSPKYCKKYCSKVVTFDKKDAVDYKIDFVDQYVFKSLLNERKNLKENSAVYLGSFKPGRVDFLLMLKTILKKINVVSDFRLVYKGYKGEFSSKSMEYVDYIRWIKNKRLLVDIVSNGQEGLTLRPIEAAYLGIKLITNNKNIINYPVYNPNNVFVVGIDSEESLINFLEKPFIDIDYDVLNYYSFSEWIKRVLS